MLGDTIPVHVSVAAELCLSVNKGMIRDVFFIGGTGAVSQGVRDRVAQVLE